MPVYYFDLKNGIPVRDHDGREFADDAQAIVHGTLLAQQIGKESPELVGRGYYISAVSDRGREIQQAPITGAGDLTMRE